LYDTSGKEKLGNIKGTVKLDELTFWNNGILRKMSIEANWQPVDKHANKYALKPKVLLSIEPSSVPGKKRIIIKGQWGEWQGKKWKRLRPPFTGSNEG